MKLQEITENLPVEVERNAEFESLGMVTHTMPNMLVFLEDEKFLPPLLQNPHITCVITTEELADVLPNNYGIAFSEDPRSIFYKLHNYLAENTDFYWKDFPTEIAKSATIGSSTHIADVSVRIGHRSIVEPGVVILPRSIISSDVILRAGCVIGSQGFEFKKFGDEVFPVSHAGGVLIHDRVEIQSNTVVDRAVFGGFTEIGEDVKIDNLVHVAHNVHIGKGSRVVALAMLGGSVTIGEEVWIGPGASISNGITIGNRAQVTIGSVVTKDVNQDQRVTGNFAIDHKKFIEFLKNIR